LDFAFRAQAASGPVGLIVNEHVWPAHPQPLDDELFSSWLVRLAQANGLKLNTLGLHVWGKTQPIWNRDIDRSASHKIVDAFCSKTGAPHERAWGTTLWGYEGILYEKHNPNGNTKWILPAGVYHRTRRRKGLMYCPLCLFEDKEPYFRRRWRLAFQTICGKHGTLMQDACPACGAPVAFFRRELGNRDIVTVDSLTLCHQCGFDLRRAPAYGPSSPDAMSLVALRSLAAFHDLGWWFCGQETMHYAPQYFEVLHHLVTFLATGKGVRLLAHIERETGWKYVDAGSLEKIPFEFRSVSQRHGLLLAALWFLAEWPDRFVTACRQARLSRTAVTRDEHFPWWYEKALREHLDRSRYVATEEEAANVAAYLARAGEGVSATKVGNMLGAKDKGAASTYKKPQHNSIPSGEELDGVIAALGVAIREKEAGSVRRLLLERDKAIFRFMRITGWPASRVLGLSVADAVRLARTVGTEDALPAAARGVLLNYLRDVRRFLVGENSGNVLFVGQKGGGIGVKNLGLRFRQAHGIM
jgi:hypothetical protein